MKPSLPIAIALLLGAVTAAHSQNPDASPEVRAQLSPRRFTTLSSEIAAKIDRLSVKEGDRFKAGQVLFALDCSIQRAQLAEAKAALAAAEKSKSVSKRLVELNSGGVLEAELAAAEAAKAQARMELAQVVLSKCSVPAPFSGRVVELKAREDSYVQAGQQVLEILDDDVLEVEFIAPSHWYGQLKAGRPFTVQVDETGQTYNAKIVRVGAKVDPVSRSVRVVGELEKGAADLASGMSGRVFIDTGH
jgi:RND family efflux transporter MFP subunit